MSLRRLACGWVLGGMLSSALIACGGRSEDPQQARGDGTDSNTHWLGRCAADEECADGLECLCGACTASCDDASACDDLGADAVCVQALCDDQGKRETGLCSKSCEENDDCPKGGECEQGVCMPGTGSLVEPSEPDSTDTDQTDTDQTDTDQTDTDQTDTDQTDQTDPPPCARMDIGDANLPCTSPALFFWNGERCAQQATCSCEGADCESMFATEQACEQAYAECQSTDPEPDAGPDGCEFLLQLDPNGPCGESDEQCEQMQSDDRVHAFSCWSLDEVEDEDGNAVNLGEAEQAARVACLETWLETAGASDVTSTETSVSAHGTWAQVGELFGVEGLRCTPECAGDTCDYCQDLDQSTCGDDPFCYAVFGTPVDEEAGCTQPDEYILCSSSDRLCDEAESAARDEAGRCWWFSSICYDPGFEYYLGGEGSCQTGYPECGETTSEPPVEGCEAMDASAGPADCPAGSNMYAWDGNGCVSVGCDCQGEDCWRLASSQAECESLWAGCIDSVPFCSDERVPNNVVASYSRGEDREQPDPALAEWTDTAWTEPEEAPVLIECSPVEGFDGNACGSLRRVTFSEGFDTPWAVELALPTAAWSAIDVNVGEPVRVRMTSTEFAVVTTENELPLILVGMGNYDGLPSAEWVLAPLTVHVAEPFCKRLYEDEPDCNWLLVTQSLTIQAPQDVAAAEDGTRPTQSLSLDPFRDAILSVGTDAGSARYHVMQGLSVYGGTLRPNLERCGAAFSRTDGFSVVRVVDDSP